MQQISEDFIQTRIMGRWFLAMRDALHARSVIDTLPAALRATVEIRLSIWGAEITTDNDAAALWIKAHYAPVTQTLVA